MPGSMGKRKLGFGDELQDRGGVVGRVVDKALSVRTSEAMIVGTREPGPQASPSGGGAGSRPPFSSSWVMITAISAPCGLLAGAVLTMVAIIRSPAAMVLSRRGHPVAGAVAV